MNNIVDVYLKDYSSIVKSILNEKKVFRDYLDEIYEEIEETEEDKNKAFKDYLRDLYIKDEAITEGDKNKVFRKYLCKHYLNAEEASTNALKIPIIDFFKKAINNFFDGAQEAIRQQIEKGRVVILAGEEEKESKDQRTVFVKNTLTGEYWVKGYVGTIHYNHEDDVKGVNIRITSRFDQHDEQPFLMYLFSKVFSENGLIFKDMPVKSNMECTWDYLLMVLFMRQLKDALKKGFYRQYVDVPYNDYTVKGRIDISRHIQENILKKQPSIAYVSREHTVNNPVNRLILQAYAHLEKQYKGFMKQATKQDDTILPGITNLKNEIPDWANESPKKLIKINKEKIVHAVHKNYEPLRKTSIAILKRLGINHFSNNRHETSGVLVYVPTLWENYLFKVLSQIENKTFVKQSSLNVLNGLLTFRPDILSKDNSVIFDAKYKIGWQDSLDSDTKKDEYIRTDVFQIIAYITAFNVTSGGVIFPVSSKFLEERNITEKDIGEARKKQAISENCMNRYFFRVPFIIPNYNGSFSDFNKGMTEQETEIHTQVSSIIKKENTEQN